MPRLHRPVLVLCGAKAKNSREVSPQNLLLSLSLLNGGWGYRAQGRLWSRDWL